MITWGDPKYGAKAHDGLTDVTQLCASERAFAALTKAGGVVAWGDVDYGGDAREVDTMGAAPRK